MDASLSVMRRARSYKRGAKQKTPRNVPEAILLGRGSIGVTGRGERKGEARKGGGRREDDIHCQRPIRRAASIENQRTPVPSKSTATPLLFG